MITALKNQLEAYLQTTNEKQLNQIQISFTILTSETESESETPVLLATLREGSIQIEIYISLLDEQMICLSNICHLNELRNDKLNELNTMMLKMNIPLPLSSFAIHDNHYVLLGSLSKNSKTENIINELCLQFHNTIDAIEMLEDYFIHEDITETQEIL